MDYSFRPSGCCARLINFTLDDQNIIKGVSFVGGCDGNLKAVSKLSVERPAKEVATLLRHNTCGRKNTSCADQFAIALIEAINQKH